MENLDKIADSKKAKRVLWIDYAKFIGICLVVCAHQSDRWLSFISAFALPVFFFLSGYLFSFKKFVDYPSFLKARIRQLVIPYFILNFVTYLLWLFFFRSFDEVYFPSNTAIHRPFIGIFYGNGINGFLVHCIASWFIICLFVVENIYFLTFRRVKGFTKLPLLIGIFLLFLFDLKYDPIRWPWSANVALLGAVFYGFGNMLKDKMHHIMDLKFILLLIISLSSFAGVYFIASINYGDMNTNHYENIFLYVAGNFLGILAVLTMGRVLEILLGPVWIMQHIGQNTLVILAFHVMLISLVHQFIGQAFDIPSVLLSSKALFIFIVVTVSVLLTLPIIYICNRYFPLMVGRTYQSKKPMHEKMVNLHASIDLKNRA